MYSVIIEGFKPCYKWNAFNTFKMTDFYFKDISFKPYYNWNAFNTEKKESMIEMLRVLNLIITGMPSILSDLIIAHFLQLNKF